MFQGGGSTTPLGPNQYRYKGQILELKPDFINELATSPYKLFPLIESGELEFGEDAQRILDQFREKDVPQIGPFSLEEDIGTNFLDAAYGVGRIVEPVVKSGIRGIGELTGSDTLRDIGGSATFDGKIGINPLKALSGQEGAAGLIPVLGSTSGSLLPSDRKRAEYNLGRYTDGAISDVEINQSAMDDAIARGFNPDNPDVPFQNTGGQFDFIQDDMNAKVRGEDDSKKINIYDPGFDPYNDGITSMIDELTESRIDMERKHDIERRRVAFEQAMVGRDEFGDPIQDMLTQLKPAEDKVDIDRTEADSLMDINAKFDGKNIPSLIDNEIKVELERVSTKENVPVVIPDKLVDGLVDASKQEQNAVTTKLNEPGFFGSDRFLNFIRNVGGELARTGQLGEGLSLGAAKASEERAARELMDKQSQKEFDDKIELARQLAIAAGKEPMDGTLAKNIQEKEVELANDLKTFEKNTSSLSSLNQVIEILNTETATGVKGFFGEATDTILAFIKSDTGESFDDLSGRTKANALIKALTQKNIKDILSESGKTISNLDRKIVEDVFGNIKLGTPLAVSLRKLGESRDDIISGLISTQTNIVSYKSYFDNVDYDSEVYRINNSLIDLVSKFRAATATDYKTGESTPGYESISLDPGT